MWKQGNLGNGNANEKHSHRKHNQMKRLKSLSIIVVLLISASVVFIKPGWTQTASITMKVEPTYIAGKVPDTIEVQLHFYGANFTDNTDVAMWQTWLEWSPSVLELNTSITWGDFLDGYRIGDFGLLFSDVAAGATSVFVADSSKFWAGHDVLIIDDLHQETNIVAGVVGSRLDLVYPLTYAYAVADNAGCYPDPDPTPGYSYSQSLGYIMLGMYQPGPAPGASGDGWLATVRFTVQQNVDTLLNIDHGNTVTMNSINEIFGDAPGELNKESGYFLSLQPGDAKPDGLIDGFDIYTVGKNWQKCPVQKKIPTTTSGSWTNPTYAYMTDDLRTYTSSNGAQQVYGGFGFVTTLWAGVSKVEIGVERRAAAPSPYDDILRIQVSDDGGSSWSTAQDTVISWVSDRFVWMDFTAAFSWTPAAIANIAVSIEYVRVGGGGTHSTIQVDWVTVRVTPTLTSTSIYADVNADSLVNAPDLALQAASYGLDYRPPI